MSLFDEQSKVVKMLLGKLKWCQNHDNVLTHCKVDFLKQKSELPYATEATDLYEDFYFMQMMEV